MIIWSIKDQEIKEDKIDEIMNNNIQTKTLLNTFFSQNERSRNKWIKKEDKID